MNFKRSFLDNRTANTLLIAAIAIGITAILFVMARDNSPASDAIAAISAEPAGSQMAAPQQGSSLPNGEIQRSAISTPPIGEGPLIVAIKDRMQIGPAHTLFNKLRSDDHDASDRATAEPEGPEEGERGLEAQSFRNLQMVDEHGIIPADAYENARRQVETMKAFQRSDNGSRSGGKRKIAGINSASWAWLGPGNIGGRIRSIVIDPTNANSIWVGSVSGGIWHTADAGASWLPVNDFMSNLAVSSMVIDPSNPNVMYAGTGEWYAAGGTEGEDIAANGLRGAGIFRSLDRGVTWTQMPNTNPSDPAVCSVGAGLNCPWSYVNRLAISPNGQTILAATASGVEITTNAGGLWQTGVNAAGVNIQDIDFDPQDPQKAVAGIIAGSGYSIDGGNSWTTATYTPAIAPGGSGRVEMAYAPSNPLLVYALVDQYTPAAQPYTSQGALYRSINGGHTFDLQAMNPGPGNTFLGAQGFYDNIIWVNPLDASFLIAGGINLYKSTDGGLNWTAIANGGNGSAHSDHHMIVASPAFNDSTNKQVYFTNDGGVYRANDVSSVSLTSGWTKLNNNLGITQFYAGATTAGGFILGGTQDNGTIKFNGATVPWTQSFSGDGGFVAADPIDANYVYGEYTSLSVIRSTNAGASGSFIFCNPAVTDGLAKCESPSTGIRDTNNGANFIAPITLDPNNVNRLYAGGLSLWVTNDLKSAGIPAWAPIKPATLTTQTANSGANDPISAIAVSPNNPDFIVVGHNDGQIYLTFNGTNTPANWVRISNNGVPAPARYVTRLVIDETRAPNWIYATFGGFAGDNIYVTKDLGATWTDVSGEGATSIPSAPVRSLLINPIHRNYLYAGTELGVFASEDAGVTWKLPQDGPANVSVDELFWYNGRLAAATFGRGVYVTGPLFVSNGGPGSGSTAWATSCDPKGSGAWSDPLSWPNLGRVPLESEDVFVVCPLRIPNSVGAHSVAIAAPISMSGSLSAVDVANLGFVLPLNGVRGSIFATNFSNAGNVTGLNVQSTADFSNSGTMNLTGSAQSGNFDNSGNMTVQSVTVGGNLQNTGSMIGSSTLSFSGTTHNILSPGQIKFASGVVPGGQTLKMLSDLTFDIDAFNVNGIMDFNSKTLKFLGGSYSCGGTAPLTGTLRLEPSLGTVVLGGNAPAVNLVSGLAKYQAGGTFTGPLNVGPGTTFRLDAAAVTIKGDVTVDGAITRENVFGGDNINFFGTTFTNNGGVTADFVKFNPSGPTPLAQNIVGLGVWSGDVISMGNASAAAPSTVTLQNDVTFATSEIQVGYTFNLNNHVLTYIGSGSQQGVAVTNSGSVAGPGTFKLQPASGTPIIRSLNSSATWGAGLRIASGSVRTTNQSFNTFIVTGPLTVDAGATLRLDSNGMDTRNTVVNNGTINMWTSGFAALYVRGSGLTNNGTIDAANVYLWPLASQPMAIAGGGTWTGNGTLYFDTLADTSFTSDVTYGSGNLTTNGPLHGVDPFVFSVPCNVPWTGNGEITGKIRRTNLAACAAGTPIRFGNGFTTIAFNSGTQPTEVLVSVEASPLVPAGFPGAVRRLYTITPTGGSGYTATLRLHYLDSELNGNDENTLELYRFDGSVWSKQGASARDTTNNWVEYSGVTQFSPWAISGPLAPTASDVSVGGQVRSFAGMGVSDAVLTLTATDGKTWTARPNPFGYYRFDNVPAGANYVINISSKRYSFSHGSLVISVNEDISNMDFVAEPLF